MLCLCVDGTIKEVRVSEITQISSDGKCTQLFLEDGCQISVDDVEENIKGMIREELKKVNQEERYIKLHLYYSSQGLDIILYAFLYRLLKWWLEVIIDMIRR